MLGLADEHHGNLLRLGESRGPACGLGHVADDRLAAFAHRHVLHPDLLLATGPVAFQRLHLGRKGSCEFAERALGAVLLLNGFNSSESRRECQYRW
jgi:hypothetical protein